MWYTGWSEPKEQKHLVLLRSKPQQKKATEAILIVGVRAFNPSAWLVILWLLATRSFSTQPMRFVQDGPITLCSEEDWRVVTRTLPKYLDAQAALMTLRKVASAVLLHSLMRCPFVCRPRNQQNMQIQ